MKKFLFFITCFLMIFSVCNAEFNSTPLTLGTNFSYSASISSSCSYSRSQIYSIASDYYNGNNIDVFETMIETLKSEGFFTVVFYSNSQVCVLLVPDTNVSVGRSSSNGDFYFTAIDSSISCPRTYMYNKSNSTWYCDVTGSKCHYLAFNIGVESSKYFSNINIKSLSYSGGYCWNGEDYFYQASSTPDNPSSNYDVSGLVSALTTSSIVQDNTDSWMTDYFIIPYGSYNNISSYEVYFYHKDVNLSAFEYLGSDEKLYFDLDKVSVDGVISNIIDFVGTYIVDSDFIRGGKHFSITYNSDTSSYDIYDSGNYFLNDLVGLRSDLNPIIYTTKNIPYFYYEYDSLNEEWIATSNTSKDILNESLLDDEGNIISPSVPGTTSPLSELPWNRFINAINSVPQTIFNGIKNLFIPDLTYLNSTWENLQTKFSFIWEAKTVVDNVCSLIELNPLAPPSLSIDLSNAESSYNWGVSTVCLDLSWYARFKPAVDFLIICFCYGFYFWRLFRKMPDIIAGVAGDIPDVQYQTQMVSNRSKHGKFGF